MNSPLCWQGSYLHKNIASYCILIHCGAQVLACRTGLQCRSAPLYVLGCAAFVVCMPAYVGALRVCMQAMFLIIGKASEVGRD